MMSHVNSAVSRTFINDFRRNTGSALRLDSIISPEIRDRVFTDGTPNTHMVDIDIFNAVSGIVDSME